ncbi:MAG: hypothetical protein GEU99_17980 [Luteitalea sp.]|nr:hypothetical protein [Luteitalea sp.]
MEGRMNIDRRAFLGRCAAAGLGLSGAVTLDVATSAQGSFGLIQTPGGSMGPTVPLNNLTAVNAAWFAPNSGDTARPVVLKIASSLTAVVPYHGLGSVNAFSSVGSVTLMGHPDVILGTGGNRKLGNVSSDAGKLSDVILQDLNFYPGVDPIADPAAPTNDSRSGTDQMPFFGATEPTEGWGQTFQNRDALHVYHVERLIMRNCTFAYGIDELLEMFRQQGNNNRVIKNVLVEDCFIGLPLRNPTDQGVPHGGAPRLLHDPAENQPHNFGGLLADGDATNDTKVQNIVFRRCVFASNSRRNPALGIADAVTVDNCLVVHWGSWGMTIRNPKSDIGIPVPTRAMFRNNLFQPGPLSNLGTVFGLIRCGTTATKLFIPGNYVISPGDDNDWANDDLLGSGDVDLQPSSGGVSNPNAIVSTPPYETAYTAMLMPTSTAEARQTLYNDILDRVGPRWRDGDGNPLLGDSNTSVLLQWALLKIRDGSIPHITFPEDATGYTT